MSTDLRINPFLAGNFAPVRTEDDFFDLPVSGVIPKELAGTLYRNGPNPQFAPRDNDHHWFVGDGMIHAFQIANGRVSYRNRYVRTPKWKLENAAGRAMYGTFGNPATSDPSVLGGDGGVANTNIIWHANRLMALEEAHLPYELDPFTLNPVGYVNYSTSERFTAHPKIDPETGELIFFSYDTNAESDDAPLLTYGVVDKNGKVTRCEQLSAPYQSMAHDFCVTKNYVVFPVMPLTFSAERLKKGLPGFAWEPDKQAYLGVMKRNAPIDSIRWFTADPFYVFHPMNMWEEDGKLFADVMQYQSAPLFPLADGSRGAESSARLARWTVDLSNKTNEFRTEYIDETNGEFPRLDERYAGLPYRHGYFAGSSLGNEDTLDAIVHVDRKSGKKAICVFGDGDVTGEPIFVPRSNDAVEGDGWLLAVVYRANKDKSDLVILDANNISMGPIGMASLPRRVPFGFHGNWKQDAPAEKPKVRAKKK